MPAYNSENYIGKALISILSQKNINWVFFEIIVVNDGSKDNFVLKIQEMVEKCQKIFKPFEFRYRPNKNLSATFNEILMHQHNLPAPTAFILKESLIKVGKYDPEIRIEDWYMWLKISKIGEIVYLPKAFSYYRDHLDNTTKKSNIMSVERFKVISNFSNDKNYSLAKQQVGWINCLEENYTGRWEKFFSKCFYLIRNPDFFLYKLTGKL